VYRRADHPHESQITGSDRAKAVRMAAAAAAPIEQMKAKRLRPLSVPQPVGGLSTTAEETEE
jgi:hypothetical protein